MPGCGEVVGAVAASADGLPITGDQAGTFQPVQRRVDRAGWQIEGVIAPERSDSMTAYPCCGPGSRTASSSASRWPLSSSGRIGSNSHRLLEIRVV